MLHNTENEYGKVAKLFHWLSAAFIFALIAVGFYMVDLPKGPDKWQIYNIHKVCGLALLLLVTARVIWRLRNMTPKAPDSLSPLEKKLAHLGHLGLYAFAFAMPLSGWLMSTAVNKLPHIGSFNIPGFPFIGESKAIAGFNHDVHEYGVWVLLLLIVVHVVAALRHHFLLKDNTLTRML